MKVEIKLLSWNIKYGYISWKIDLSDNMEEIFRGITKKAINFLGKDISKRRVDWKRRRISIGKDKMRELKKGDVLEISKLNKAIIITKK